MGMTIEQNVNQVPVDLIYMGRFAFRSISNCIFAKPQKGELED